MKEKNILRFSILFYWTFFWGLSVLDKIIPDVHHLWVGKDFFALFVKFFGSGRSKITAFFCLPVNLRIEENNMPSTLIKLLDISSYM